jgi:hypothetical protein
LNPRFGLFAFGALAIAATPACNAITGASDLALGSSPGAGATTLGGAGGGATGTGSAGGAGSGGGATTTTTEPQPIAAPLAADVDIAEVNLQQGVSIVLAKDGKAVAPNAPVVQRRTALLRVIAAPRASFAKRELLAELDLADGAGAKPPRQVKKLVSGPGSETTLDGSFNFEIPADQVTADLTFSVSLREAVGGTESGDTTGAEYPAGGGKAPLGAKDARGAFRIELVPFKYGADGSNRLPATDAAQVEVYHRRFLGTYPAPDTEIKVHAAVPFMVEFSPEGAGWGELLQATCELRAKENPDRNVFYYGVIEPAASFNQFCQAGCVAGLANLTEDPNDEYGRCSIGLGYSGQDSADVALQEIAHNLGRRHADCGNPDMVDPSYPYSGGKVGTWGWDQTSKTLQSPGLKDFMSYCQPVWISDYTYAALFDRIAHVNASAYIVAPPGGPTEWRQVLVRRDGSATVGARIPLRTPPSGAPREVELRDARGVSAGRVTGRFYPFDRLGGGTLLLPADALPEGGSVQPL